VELVLLLAVLAVSLIMVVASSRQRSWKVIWDLTNEIIFRMLFQRWNGAPFVVLYDRS
jgi:hypothetical protein